MRHAVAHLCQFEEREDAMALRRAACAWFLALAAAQEAASGAGKKAPIDKGLTEQVVIRGGWLTFGTSCAFAAPPPSCVLFWPPSSTLFFS